MYIGMVFISFVLFSGYVVIFCKGLEKAKKNKDTEDIYFHYWWGALMCGLFIMMLGWIIHAPTVFFR